MRKQPRILFLSEMLSSGHYKSAKLNRDSHDSEIHYQPNKQNVINGRSCHIGMNESPNKI
jgi:hypothetical protein